MRKHYSNWFQIIVTKFRHRGTTQIKMRHGLVFAVPTHFALPISVGIAHLLEA